MLTLWRFLFQFLNPKNPITQFLNPKKSRGGKTKNTLLACAEAVAKWRELNTSEAFLEVVAELHPLIETLPLLVHHAEQVRRRPMLFLHILPIAACYR
jgi:hypothetical protein